MTAPTPEPAPTPAPAPAPAPVSSPPRLTALFASLLSAIPSLAIAGTAFLYFAGYIYLDDYRRYAGLAFGAAETSTSEIMAQGYIVLWFSLFDRFWQIMAAAVLPGLIAFPVVVLIGFALMYGRTRGWRGFGATIAIVQKLAARAEALPNYLFFSAMLIVALVSAMPAGTNAAQHEYRASVAKVHRGCCFRYVVKGSPTATGFPVAADKDRLFVLTSAGTVAVPTEGLTVVRIHNGPSASSSAR